MIVGDITIGRGAIIGANAVVTKSVPPYSVVMPGCPVGCSVAATRLRSAIRPILLDGLAGKP